MRTLPMAMLRHTLADGSSHYDWLMQSPVADEHPDGRLWTARVEHDPMSWHAGFRATLTVIDPHRPIYLTYQGPVSGDRGVVRRVASGVIKPKLWTTAKRRIDLHWQQPVACVQEVTLHLAQRQAWFEVHGVASG